MAIPNPSDSSQGFCQCESWNITITDFRATQCGTEMCRLDYNQTDTATSIKFLNLGIDYEFTGTGGALPSPIKPVINCSARTVEPNPIWRTLTERDVVITPYAITPDYVLVNNVTNTIEHWGSGGTVLISYSFPPTKIMGKDTWELEPNDEAALECDIVVGNIFVNATKHFEYVVQIVRV